MTRKVLFAGETATFATGDGTGWRRQPAPADGLLLDGDETSVFVPEAWMREALAELDHRRGRTAVVVPPPVKVKAAKAARR